MLVKYVVVTLSSGMLALTYNYFLKLFIDSFDAEANCSKIKKWTNKMQ